MTGLTKLHLNFSEHDHASVYFAHLQNLMLDFQNQEISNILLLQKIDKVLLDIYSEYLKLQKQHIQVTMNLKNMLVECNQIITSCKNDRQDLAKVTQDRYDIMQKLQKSTDESLHYLQQNYNLKQTMATMKELNKLLIQKHSCLEDQINSLQITNQGNSYLGNLKNQYDVIFNSNTKIQEELNQLVMKTQMIEEISVPLQIISLAFESNKSLKELVWQQVQRQKGASFPHREEMRSQFMKFNFMALIKELK